MNKKIIRKIYIFSVFLGLFSISLMFPNIVKAMDSPIDSSRPLSRVNAFFYTVDDPKIILETGWNLLDNHNFYTGNVTYRDVVKDLPLVSIAYNNINKDLLFIPGIKIISQYTQGQISAEQAFEKTNIHLDDGFLDPLMGYALDEVAFDRELDKIITEDNSTLMIPFRKDESTITIKYLFENGKEALPEHTTSGFTWLTPKTEVESPEIDGYFASQEKVPLDFKKGSQIIEVIYKPKTTTPDSSTSATDSSTSTPDSSTSTPDSSTSTPDSSTSATESSTSTPDSSTSTTESSTSTPDSSTSATDSSTSTPDSSTSATGKSKSLSKKQVPDKSKQLPHTGESSTVLISVVGVILLSVVGFLVYLKRKTK
ncbi:LPXTG cell wall anchor domain-containing protein [Enterococcus faecalis]|nr:LPXTG cell wall anchor domain-containing protein [Enterococcus faecalis]